ncbi:MAG: heterodisulfide reductase subunit B [Nitrospirae bacterium]|nr:MAG: heterodisulfide reductase subunit B [Nitrospirota bacterium]
MTLKYAFYPGCAAKGATPELYQSTMAILAHLGLEVVELEAASCCGAGVLTEKDPEVALTLNARTFAQAERLGLDVMTICGTCQGVMAQANKRLQDDPELRQRVNRLLQEEGLTYEGRVQVKHLLWIVVKEVGLKRLAERSQFPLADIRIAPFYGCYILRPSWLLGFDDPEHPTSLEKVIRAVGAEPVMYSGRTKCCGFPVILEREAVALAMNGNNLKEAKEEGADCLVTPCPLCHMSLDIYQERAGHAVRANFNLPILHLPQLIGLAMGIPAQQLGTARHLIPVESLLTKHRRTQQPGSQSAQSE